MSAVRKLALVALTIFLGIHGALAGPPASRPLPDGVTPEMVTNGHALFNGQATCFRCHWKEARGTFIAPALDDENHLNLQTAAYEEIVERIRIGVPKPKRHLGSMPPRGGTDLTEEELRAVAAYVYSIDKYR